ncbi:unnamed protein product [Effrenium voratum]|nr:unnamed protein product [Effrenium voratum]
MHLTCCLGCVSKGKAEPATPDIVSVVPKEKDEALEASDGGLEKYCKAQDSKVRMTQDMWDCSTVPSEPTPECQRSTTMMTEMDLSTVPSERPRQHSEPCPPIEPADQQQLQHLPSRSAPVSPVHQAHSQDASPRRKRDAFRKVGRGLTARLTVGRGLGGWAAGRLGGCTES